MKDFFKFVTRYALPYKWFVLASLFFNILATFFTVFSFAFIMPILNMLFSIDTKEYFYMEMSAGNLNDVLVNNFYYYIGTVVAKHGAVHALALLCALLLIMTFIKVFTAYCADWFNSPIQNGLERDIRNSIYSKILKLPIGFFTNEKKGDIMARCSDDIKELRVSVMTSIASLLKYPIAIVCSLAVMIYLSWQLTLFVLVLIPIFGSLMGIIGSKLKAQSLRSQQLGGSILSDIDETIGGLRIIKAFNAESQMRSNFQSETNELYRVNNAVNRRIALAHPVSEFLGTTAVAVILWLGGSLIIKGNAATLDASMFIFYLLMFYNIINPAKELSKAGYTIQKGMAAMVRIDKILNAVNPIADPAEPVEIPHREHAGITLRNVTFSYDGERDVLSDINLEIEPGQTVALVGQSGSGKSTLVDLIPRFWDVTEGEIEINGVNVKNFRVKELRDLMGNVSQEAILFNDTIFNNIAFGMPGATREQVEQAARIANAHDFIVETENGYDTYIGDRGCRLSGGQRQRISIARAVLKDPDILILDEATSALDTESERLVQDALERLMEDRTTVVIAHRLSTIVNADKICVINQGRIVEEGTHAELIALNGIYKKLVDMQQV